jgi:hypothetical protein
MGMKAGEKIERLCQVRVTSVRRESLQVMCDDRTYGRKEASREGFPKLQGHEFVLMFCQHMGCGMDQEVTRIEFEYL